MPGTISFDGLATGINTTDTVDKLMEVEARPQTLKEAEKARLENELSTWQEINTNLLDLRTQAQTLWKSSTWNTLSASSSNSSILTATTTSTARPGTYTLEVTSLAQSHQIASQTFASELSTVGTGSLTIEVNSKATEITLNSANNTLTGVADAINKAGAGVTASVISDGSGYRLMMVSNETGTANAIALTEGGTVSLGATTIQDAQDTQINLGSGAGAISISSPSNQVSDVISGVTLNLASASPGTTVTLGVTRDTSAVEDQINSFVDSYNTAMSYVGAQFVFDSKTNTGGILMGDRTLLGIQDRIQTLISDAVQTGGTYTSLRAIGLAWDDDGTLSFDAEKFATAVNTDYDSVQALFGTAGQTQDSKISFVYAGIKAKEPSAEGYAVEITRAAEHAAAEASADVGSLTVDDTNDTLTLALDGGSSFSITLAHDTYASYEALASEIQSKINAASPGGGQVTVTADGGRLTVTSQRYGSASEVQLVGGNGLSNLGFSAGDEGRGVDVAGTIDGEAATGSGQYLTGADGNTNTDGVQLKVELTPDDLTGAGGSVETELHFSKGVATRLNEYLQGLTMPAVGTIGMKETALGDSIQSTQDRIDEMQARLDQKRQSLLDQFTRMETAVSDLNSQGNYLTNMLSGLNKNWSWNG